jgi:phage shock protein A
MSDLDRRKSDIDMIRALEIIEEMNKDSKAINADVRQLISDTETVFHIRLEHLDKIADQLHKSIESIRSDNKDFYKQLLDRMDEKHANQDKRIEAVEGCVDEQNEAHKEEIKGIKEDIKGLKTRIETLETAPVKKSAFRWDKAVDSTIWAVLGAATVLAIAYVKQFFEGPKR